VQDLGFVGRASAAPPGDECCGQGLPPAVVGTPPDIPAQPLPARFIPTYVGNTLSIGKAPAAISVYPHACGEHTTTWSIFNRDSGLSPRMWGTRLSAINISLCWRFIPTYVGNTAFSLYRQPGTAVYPHVCGEHFDVSNGGHVEDGLSPRMWGTPTTNSPVFAWMRFIPTYVGNIRQPGRCYRPPTVYPHACGEYNFVALPVLAANGLSPRMWGTHEACWRFRFG